jgi:uncharacterized membrane protein
MAKKKVKKSKSKSSVKTVQKESKTVSSKEEKKMANNTGLDQNVAGALCYILGLITGIVFLVIEPNNKYIKFHAMQSILWSVMFILISIVIGVIGTIIGFVTLGLGFVLLGLVMMLINLVLLITWLWLMWQAYQGNKWKFPVVGNIAENMSK